MRRFLKLKPIGEHWKKVIAVIRASHLDDTMVREYVEAPPDKSDKELLGTLISSSGQVPVTTKKTLFVIPTYLANEKLERCLRTLKEYHDGIMNYEIVVVFDGGPNPELAKTLASKYGVNLVVLEKNSGFSSAINAGIRSNDDAENIVLVNDDLWFDSPAGAYLAETLETSPDVGIVGSLLLYPNGLVQHAGKESASGHTLHGQPVQESALQDRDVMNVTGALIGISQKFLEQTLRLDESYRMAWEDADLCLTAHTLGWRVRYCGRAYAYHDEGGTRGATPEKKQEFKDWNDWDNAGRETFINKWGSDYASKKWIVKPSRTFIKRLIVKRTTALGDVLLTTPIIHALREKRPDWEIIVATAHPFIFRDNPDINYVVPPDHGWVTSKNCEDFYELDLSYESNPDKSIAQAYAEACNVYIEDQVPRVYLRNSNLEFAKKMLGSGSDWVVIHPGPKGWPGGDWPNENSYKVSESIREKGFKVVLVGNSTRSFMPCDLDLRNKTTFHNLAAIIERSTLFVGIDSMPLHLAEAFKKPGVGVFGCISPDRVLIKGSSVIGVTASAQETECLGCHHRHASPQTWCGCEMKTVYCMKNLKYEDIVEAACRVRLK